MAQMYSWLKTLYGDSDDFNWSQFGLPQDKVRNPMKTFAKKYENEFDLRILILSPQYDRAALTIMVQTQAASKEERFINDFFVNDEL